jgi:hypothetical protein
MVGRAAAFDVSRWVKLEVVSGMTEIRQGTPGTGTGTVVVSGQTTGQEQRMRRTH